MFPLNDFSVFLITKCFMLNVKGFLDSPLDAIHQICKSSQVIILNVFQYKMSNILQFVANQIHTELLKPARFVFCVIIMVIPSMLCFSSFLTISYCFPWCFRMFPLVFLRFPWVFLMFPLSVSPVSYFRFCEKVSRSIQRISRKFLL